MFSRPGLAMIALALIVGAWNGQAALVLLAGALLALWGMSRAWSKLSLLRLAGGARLDRRRAFPGQSVRLTLEMDNGKPLPLAWARAGLELPLAVAPPGMKPLEGGQRVRLELSSPLLWYQKAKREFILPCARRGWHPLGPFSLATGDPFGLYPRQRQEAVVQELVILPRLMSLAALGLPSRFPLGESRALTRLFEDPTRVAGLRPYTTDTPFKHIHWKSSARRRELQVKLFEPSTTLQVVIFLDLDGFKPGDDYELAVSLAATLADHLAGLRHPVGLMANGVPAGRRGFLRLLPSSGPGHLVNLMEELARLDPPASLPLAQLWDACRSDLAWGSTVVAISAGLAPAAAAELVAWKREGGQVQALLVGEGAQPPAGLACRRVGRTGQMDKP